jgi:hypothetical protein
LPLLPLPSCRRGNPKAEDQSAALIGSFCLLKDGLSAWSTLGLRHGLSVKRAIS